MKACAHVAIMKTGEIFMKSFFEAISFRAAKCLLGMFSCLVVMLFAYFFLVSTVRSTSEAAKFDDDRFRIVLCLSIMVVILLWMLVNAYMRRRLTGWVGGLMFIYTSLVLMGVSLEYSKLYGVNTILRSSGGFRDACASAKDAVDLVQDDSLGVLTSVEVKRAQDGCMRITFWANGKDGARWIGHGLKLTSNKVKWTVKREVHDFASVTVNNPANDILHAYTAFSAQDEDISNQASLKISWNAQLGQWVRE